MYTLYKSGIERYRLVVLPMRTLEMDLKLEHSREVPLSTFKSPLQQLPKLSPENSTHKSPEVYFCGSI